MPTYYVRPDGNNGNAGTGPSIAQAWATLGKALGATGITGGDTLYIAPGRYAEQITLGGTYSSATSIIGDPLCTQFTGLTTGKVFITNIANTGTSLFSGALLSGSGKSNLTFSNIAFENTINSSVAVCVSLLLGANNGFVKCTFRQSSQGGILCTFTPPTSSALNATLSNCVMMGGVVNLTGSNVSDTTSIKNCIFNGSTGYYLATFSIGLLIYNCTFLTTVSYALVHSSGSLSFPSYVRNCVFVGVANSLYSSTLGHVIQEYNRLMSSTVFQVASSVTSTTNGNASTDDGYSLLTGLGANMFHSSELGQFNTSFGTATGTPVTDIYGFAWSGTSPDAGASTYKLLTAINPTYNPTERNASAITIAPASTSQSIELYLGATGLVFNTSGLAAYYVRNQSAPVAITLVTQTPTGAWASGGFAEISSSLVPGVYRLDVPNAAFAAGASDVTIVVRGASGTNGAVLTVTLSSGGLTEAQTAGAVWNAVRATYPTVGTFGEYVNVNVNSGAIADAVWDEARSGHTTVGTFGQYVNAELVTPVTSAALVRMGPFEVRADGLGASDPLDIQKGAQHGIDIQCVDNNGAGIDITSATVTAKVYNSGATLVDTYACTATYAADGRATFTIDTTVTNVPGTYTATITRTTGASDTQVFGPLRIYVRDI
jgi:hypothetical protein